MGNRVFVGGRGNLRGNAEKVGESWGNVGGSQNQTKENKKIDLIAEMENIITEQQNLNPNENQTAKNKNKMAKSPPQLQNICILLHKRMTFSLNLYSCVGLLILHQPQR